MPRTRLLAVGLVTTACGHDGASDPADAERTLARTRLAQRQAPLKPHYPRHRPRRRSSRQETLSLRLGEVVPADPTGPQPMPASVNRVTNK